MKCRTEYSRRMGANNDNEGKIDDGKGEVLVE